MALFHSGKKKEKEKAPTRTCACSMPEGACTPIDRCPDSGEAGESAHCVKVLGTGCARCHALLQSAQTAAHAQDEHTEVEYITDMAEILQYGVMRLPALVVNGEVVSVGRVLKPEEVEALLRQSGWRQSQNSR